MPSSSAPERSAPESSPSRVQSWAMFDRIAQRYDLLNHLLSGGIDVLWRQRVAEAVMAAQPARVLDVATGTADQLVTLYHMAGGSLKFGLGVDMAAEMLELGQRKLPPDRDIRFRLARGDALALPVADGTMDAVTICFGIRNVVDAERGLAEMARVLRPGGTCVVLEFSLPANAQLRQGYLLYFRHVLPRIGGLVSGDDQAYRYLNETVESFPYGEDFCALMRAAGFAEVSVTPLTFGIASIYRGRKEGEG